MKTSPEREYVECRELKQECLGALPPRGDEPDSYYCTGNRSRILEEEKLGGQEHVSISRDAGSFG